MGRMPPRIAAACAVSRLLDPAEQDLGIRLPGKIEIRVRNVLCSHQLPLWRLLPGVRGGIHGKQQ